MGELFLNNGESITLNVKGAADVEVATVNKNVVDKNGCTDLVSSVGTIYMSDVTGEYNCAQNDNDCYPMAVGDCEISSCTSTVDMIATVTCTSSLKYFAIPTEEDLAKTNPWRDYNWLSYINVFDGANYEHATSSGVEVNILLGLGVEEDEIDFGSNITAGQNTGIKNSTTTVENMGNSPLDANVSGSDLTAVPSGTITVDNIKFNLNNFNYEVEINTLAGFGKPAGIYAPRPTTTTDVKDKILWGIGIPPTADSATYNGQNYFSALLDTENWTE